MQRDGPTGKHGIRRRRRQQRQRQALYFVRSCIPTVVIFGRTKVQATIHRPLVARRIERTVFEVGWQDTPPSVSPPSKSFFLGQSNHRCARGRILDPPPPPYPTPKHSLFAARARGVTWFPVRLNSDYGNISPPPFPHLFGVAPGCAVHDPAEERLVHPPVGAHPSDVGEASPYKARKNPGNKKSRRESVRGYRRRIAARCGETRGMHPLGLRGDYYCSICCKTKVSVGSRGNTMIVCHGANV